MNGIEKALGAGSIIDFAKGGDFRGEMVTGLQYGFEIDNQSANSVTVAVCVGSSATLGTIQKKFPNVDAILGEGVLMTDVTAKGLDSSNDLNDFKQFYQNNPLKVVEINIDCDKKDVFNTKIESKEVSLFGEKANDQIFLANYQDEKDFRVDRKRVNLHAEKKELFFHNQRIITFEIPALSKVTYNFKIGAVLSPALFLEKFSNHARKVIDGNYNVSYAK